MAHSSAADHHMGEAAAMCLAIVVGGAAVATLPGLRERPQVRRPLLQLASPTPPQLALSAQHLARGDPALLQVFRR
jgi:hypothetical protein